MKSMTGYGKATFSNEFYLLELDIKTLNSRYLDIKLHAPRELLGYENELKESISQTIKRGKIELRINFIDKRVPELNLNEKKLQAVWDILSEIKKITENQVTLSLDSLLENYDLIELKQNELNNEFKKILYSTLNKAIINHQNIAVNDGNNMKKFLLSSANRMLDSLHRIEEIFPAYKEELTKKIHNILHEIIGNKKIDPGIDNRLSTEIAFYIERSDISEELIRLENHLKKFNDIIKTKESEVGKVLNFILQEMHRETNTIGSKFNYKEAFNDILNIKEEIEKCREIVQNVE